ncbi:MAG TPA: hypothetical protein VK880_14475 [Anaerolineales bacterium]|nr:hypothetical protein [Anaerolineales bacterium]
MNNKRLLSIILVGGILGLAASVESATRIFAPVIGGAFGALVMAGVFVYVFIKIYNHPTVFTLKQDSVPVRVSTDD